MNINKIYVLNTELPLCDIASDNSKWTKAILEYSLFTVKKKFNDSHLLFFSAGGLKFQV